MISGLELTAQATSFCSKWEGKFFTSGAMQELRKTDLISHMANAQLLPNDIFRASFDLLYAMGALDLAAAVGFTMHQYTLSTIATTPIQDQKSIDKRDRFLEAICRERMLCAVSSFDMKIDSDGTIAAGLRAKKEGDHWIVSGKKRYQSMASFADVLFFSAAISDRSFGLFYLGLKNNKDILLGKSPDTEFMRATDTRGIAFNAVKIPDHQLLTITNIDETKGFHSYSLSWFQALIPAAYLGAAYSALKLYAKMIGSATPSATSDLALKHENAIGRMDLELGIALNLRYKVEAALAMLPTSPLKSMEAFDGASELFKYAGTKLAAAVVSELRNIGGLRLLVGESQFARIADYVPYGALHPRSNSDLESTWGRAILA